MRILLPLILLILVLIIPETDAGELSGYIAGEVRVFPNTPLYEGQKRNNMSLVIQPEYYHEWVNGSSVTLIPFARIDSADKERTHFDIRELNFHWVHKQWSLRAGIGKVFWGATEFLHLVDIINQDDAVESIDGEDKLGQPMVQLIVPSEWGTFEIFILPYFRERTFPGKKGRLRGSIVVDTDNTQYESSKEKRHVDLALRYSNTFGNMDFGLYYFRGTGREPTLIPGLDKENAPVLIPFYEKIWQVGNDVQSVIGPWLLKLESLYRSGQGNEFFAYTGGFEYTFFSLIGTNMDLGVVGEYAYDDRGSASTIALQNDIMFGLRLALNDFSSTEVLTGISYDLKNSSRLLSIEASRRFGDRWKLYIEARAFSNMNNEDVLYDLRDDDHLLVELRYYF